MCRVAQFESFDAAVEHEETCDGNPPPNPPPDDTQKKDDQKKDDLAAARGFVDAPLQQSPAAKQPTKQTEANERRWQKNLATLRECIDQSTGQISYATVDGDTRKKIKSFVKTQRKDYRKREGGKAGAMTDERYRQLVDCGFPFVYDPPAPPPADGDDDDAPNADDADGDDAAGGGSDEEEEGAATAKKPAASPAPAAVPSTAASASADPPPPSRPLEVFHQILRDSNDTPCFSRIAPFHRTVLKSMSLSCVPGSGGGGEEDGDGGKGDPARVSCRFCGEVFLSTRIAADGSRYWSLADLTADTYSR